MTYRAKSSQVCGKYFGIFYYFTGNNFNSMGRLLAGTSITFLVINDAVIRDPHTVERHDNDSNDCGRNPIEICHLNEKSQLVVVRRVEKSPDK